MSQPMSGYRFSASVTMNQPVFRSACSTCGGILVFIQAQDDMLVADSILAWLKRGETVRMLAPDDFIVELHGKFGHSDGCPAAVRDALKVTQ